MYRSFQRKQSGAVALFVVIFSALLLSIVTLSFIRLMLSDQQQATAADLSQSAYDAAEAGVEDAKQLLLLNQECQANASAMSNCGAILAAVKPAAGSDQTGCYALEALGSFETTGTDGNKERMIQQNASIDGKLDQAYTCVKIAVNTDDYLGELDAGQSVVVPLASTGPFSTVELSWFSDKDLSGTGSQAVTFPSTGSKTDLPPLGDAWGSNSPALMRAQLIQVWQQFTLTDFNSSKDASTLFLYPSQVGTQTLSYSLDARRTPTNVPQAVRCQNNLAAGGYACTAKLQLQNPVSGSASDRRAYLHLSALYNRTHFQVRLLNGASVVKFAGAQPEVDSTGRANDQFRRVKARVELHTDFSYPDAALTVTGDLCKAFTVTTDKSGYSTRCSNP